MYKLVKQASNNELAETIMRVADFAYIPKNPDNTDYQAYLAWLAEGNTPLPAENT
jgi:hypothetical protein